MTNKKGGDKMMIIERMNDKEWVKIFIKDVEDIETWWISFGTKGDDIGRFERFIEVTDAFPTSRAEVEEFAEAFIA